MPVLARKITRAKWERADGLAEGEVAADAVTVDLRTSGNTLSFWTCTIPSEEELRETVLALAANAERLDKFDIAWLDEAAVCSAGLATNPTDGDTPVLTLRARHVDVEKLDYVRLGKVADLLVAALALNHHKRMTKKEVLEILKAAVLDRRVALDDLKNGVRVEVEKALG